MSDMREFGVFREAFLATERLDAARKKAKYDYEMAVNAHRDALEEQTRLYGILIKAIKVSGE